MQLIPVFNFFYALVMDGHLLAQKSKGSLLKLNQIKVDKTQGIHLQGVTRCSGWGGEGSKRGRQATKFSFLKQREFVTGREEVSG